MEHILFGIVSWLIGYQIYNKDFILLTGQYNYRIGTAQCITYVAFAMMFLSVFIGPNDIVQQSFFGGAGIVIVAISEYILSRIHSPLISFNVGIRIGVVVATAVCFSLFGCRDFLIFFLMGWYVRNVKFGVPHRNILIVAKYLKHDIVYCKTEEKVDIPNGMPIFSHAGNHQDNKQHNLPVYNVTDYNILPDTKEDLIDKVQTLIDKVGEKGGGTIFFPKGKYEFNKTGGKRFLQVNYSYITIEGEIGEDGSPLTEFTNFGSLVCGEKYPWLSPFFITTGEQIQKSNMFFGLQFRKRKKVLMRSGSMSDPGSDGNILTPEFASIIIEGSRKGEDIIYVEDSSVLGKYIMLGMYNTDKEATLLKDILGQDLLRPAWKAALRAGEEEAPSFQWLIEIKEVIDTHKVRLVQPLWRDFDMRYEPAVFNVPMLEGISIKNIRLRSTWNGMIRHHGHKRYYSVAQAQEMDYGWNGINMKRVAHGIIENVIFEDFTNPLYVMDSRNVSCKHLVFRGHDGHQGIKVYEHACDNLFSDIVFYNHYADMMGGEGNAYGNVFSDIKYLNPCFKPADYDFHGFSEGPMSPPSYNLFENVYGFAHISSSGSEHMMPSCGRSNVWWNCYCEGEKKDSLLFRQRYRPTLLIRDKIHIIITVFFSCAIKHYYSRRTISLCYQEIKSKYCMKILMSYSEISSLYTDFYLYGIHTKSNLNVMDKKKLHIKYENKTCIPQSIYHHR